MPKANIHPTYYPKATVVCSCGATHVMGATKESLKVDICSECHPFYSGTQKLIDTAGRVDRFREKMAAAQARQTVKTKEVAPAKEEATEAPVSEEATDAGKDEE